MNRSEVMQFITADLWGQQVADFCCEVIDRPVRLVGNSIGGVVALRAAQLLGPAAEGWCDDCAQRRWTTSNWPQPA